MSAIASTARTSVIPAVVTAAVVAGLLGPGSLPKLSALLLIGVIGLSVLLVRERIVLNFTAFVIAGAPLLPAPGLGAPLILVLGLAVWTALLASPRAVIRFGWVEAFVALTIVVAGISVLMTSADGASIVELGRWAIAFSLVIPLRMIHPADLTALGRWFVAGGCFGAVVGLLLFAIDRQGQLLNRLSAFGYDTKGGNLRLVRGSESEAVRLTGTYVDPNMGALVLTIALVLAVVLLRGLPRIAASGLIGVAILLTLSRASIATVAVALLVLVVAGRIPLKPRLALSAVVAAGVVIALSIPVVRERLLDSFGPNDTGSQARWAALADFRRSMDDHWWFGLGWGIDAFRDPAAGVKVNYVANAPLLTVYRAGIVVGAAFVMLLIGAVLRSITLLRRGTFAQATVAAAMFALCLVALQLDFSVALLPPATMAFAVLLAFVTHPRWNGDNA